MSCDVGEVIESLENEQSSFSNLSITSHTSQLILQPFHRFTYITAHSPILPLLNLHHSSFSNPSFASYTSQALHLIHLASRPCAEFRNCEVMILQICSHTRSSIMMDGIPLHSSCTCCRLAVNCLHQQSTICLLMMLGPFSVLYD